MASFPKNVVVCAGSYRYGLIPKYVPNTHAGTVGLRVFGVVWSTITWPPSPLAWSNQRLLTTDLRSVPLSCVPPQYWPGMSGTVAAEVNWVICRPVEWSSAAVVGLTVPLRFTQSTALSGAP